MATDPIEKTMEDIRTERHESMGKVDAEYKDTALEAATKGQGVSGFESLTPWDTIKVSNINGKRIANPGFVTQFGTGINGDGETCLEAPVLSGWSAIMSIGQIIGMTSLFFFSDRFGHKAAMYAY